MTKEPLGNLQIEMDLALSDGAGAQLISLLGKDLDLPALDCTVTKSTGIDHYYQYAHAYHLNWNSTVDLRARLDAWLKDHKDAFTLPKTKLLFVTDKMQWQWEDRLPKGVFSVYTETPRRVSRAHLERLNPRIVVFEERTNALMNVLEEWSLANPEPPKILRKWPDGNEKAFLDEIHTALRDRVEKSIGGAFYFARKSAYSRFAIRMKGEILSVAQYYFRMRLPNVVSPGTILRVVCPFLDDPKRSVVFARVVETHEGVAECCVVPESENPNQTLNELKLLFEAGSRQKIEVPKPLSQPAHGADLWFLEAAREAHGLLVWIRQGFRNFWRWFDRR